MLKAPFPYFGGKSRVSDIVWKRFGNVPNYVEPFAGSLAVLLGRPKEHFRRSLIETVNDKDAFIDNFWRALQAKPDELTKLCDWPVNEASLRARHRWLFEHREQLTERIMRDPDYFHLKIAGWWVWGICMWIGSDWCRNLSNKRPSLNNAGRGVHRGGVPVDVNYFRKISNRLRSVRGSVRICCGDWQRILGRVPTESLGKTAVFLDPPYGDERTSDLYREDDSKLYLKVRDWAIENGDNPKLRIALCGYVTELDMPDSWERVLWKAHGGYALQSTQQTKAKKNVKKEAVWFSPHCINVKTQMGLLGKPLGG